MPNPLAPEPEREVATGRNRPLREADPRDLADASAELRQRTMSLEPDEILPAKRLLGAIVAGAVAIAVGALLFRSEIRAVLGLG